MGLEEILQGIREDGRAEVAAIGQQADREAAAILARARARAEADAERLSQAGADALAAERGRLGLAAEVDAARGLRRAREDVFAGALAAAREALAATRERPGYPELLQELLAEALAMCPHPEEVRVDARDVALLDAVPALRATLGPLRAAATAAPTWGGVEVSGADGRVLVRDTLEERLARAEPQLRTIVSRVVPGLLPELLPPDPRPAAVVA